MRKLLSLFKAGRKRVPEKYHVWPKHSSTETTGRNFLVVNLFGKNLDGEGLMAENTVS
jgi:hypothetical protein